MIPSPPLADQFHKVFQPTARGVVGLVDDLLEMCAFYRLNMRFHGNQCHFSSLESESQEFFEVPLPKSVFRAVLARISTLLNEQHPSSVMPYSGKGELLIPVSQTGANDTLATCYVEFTNTPTDQRLEMRYLKQAEFARLLPVAVRSLATLESGTPPSDAVARKLIEIERLTKALSEVITPDSLGQWLQTPNPAFEGLKPLEVIERGESDRIWSMIFFLRSGVPS